MQTKPNSLEILVDFDRLWFLMGLISQKCPIWPRIAMKSTKSLLIREVTLFECLFWIIFSVFRTYGSQWCIHPEKIAFEIKSGYYRFFEFHYLIQMQKLLTVFCLRSQLNPCPSTADCVVSMDCEVLRDFWVTEDYWSLLNLEPGPQRMLARLWEPQGDFLSLIFLS